jgi:hypothetical protein
MYVKTYPNITVHVCQYLFPHLSIHLILSCTLIPPRPVPEFIDPRFRENKPKTLVFSHRKRAYWACFRENYVYNFRHCICQYYSLTVFTVHTDSKNLHTLHVYSLALRAVTGNRNQSTLFYLSYKILLNSCHPIL